MRRLSSALAAPSSASTQIQVFACSKSAKATSGSDPSLQVSLAPELHTSMTVVIVAAAAATMTTVMLVWSSGANDTWSDGSLPDVAFALLEHANTWIWVLA